MRSNEAAREPSGSITEAARRAQIVSAAVKVLADRGFAAASLSAIAGEVGISKGVISYHFAGKTELLHEVVRHVLQDASTWMTPRIAGAGSYGEALRSYIAANLGYLDEHRAEIVALTEVLANARATPGAEEIFRAAQLEAIAALQAIFDGGVASGEFAALPSHTAAIALRAAIDAASTNLRADPGLDLTDFGAELADLNARLVARR
jgi:AcrR family transcriptional regulator